MSEPEASFDPGWCFVAAGLLLVAAAVLVPAWRDVERLREQVSVLEHRVAHAKARDVIGGEVLEAFRANDPTTYQRLMAWQWNVVPLGDEAVIREQHDGGISSWVEARTPEPGPPHVAVPVTRLERLLTGLVRPWVLAAGGLCLLVGIIALPLGQRMSPILGHPSN